MTLVLHRGEDVLGSPVEGRSNRSVDFGDEDGGGLLSGDHVNEVDGLEFFFSEIGEGVETHLVGFIGLSVVLLDHEVVFGEDGLSVEFFFRGGGSLDSEGVFPLLVGSENISVVLSNARGAQEDTSDGEEDNTCNSEKELFVHFLLVLVILIF